MIEKEPLAFQEAIKLAIKHFADFNGRSRRSEYWWAMLALYVISVVLPVTPFVLDIVSAPLTFRRLHDTGHSGWWFGVFVVVEYISLFFLIAAFAVLSIFSILTSGTLFLFMLPIFLIWVALLFIYRVFLLILLCLDSDPMENQYGRSPKYESDPI